MDRSTRGSASGETSITEVLATSSLGDSSIPWTHPAGQSSQTLGGRPLQPCRSV
jgi:hypothetical protein